MVRYAILGPIELRDGGRRHPLDGRVRLALMAMLLLHANRPVSVDALAEALWSDHNPGRTAKRLQMTVARLRATLGACGGADASAALQTVPGGYLLHVRAGELDAEVFSAAAHDGRAALAAGDSEGAARVLREALALWRGPPLAQVAYEEFAQAEIRRLDELRLAALEGRIEADLRLGRHAELIAELEALVARYATRERLVEHLMLALYRSGRHVEALDVYGRTRARLADELGLEPGPALKAVQQAILGHSSSLEVAVDDRVLPDAGSDAALARSAEKARPQARGEARRLVSVLAARADVNDPEALHGVFDRCVATIERQSGLVERYLGDVLVGLFGLTESRGDEALRAARAATELRAEQPVMRFGLDAGEVFLGADAGGAMTATGGAITRAGRLAERAEQGEILVGNGIRQVLAARARVDAESGRLLGLDLEGPRLRRTRPTPFIGRTNELEVLHAALARVRAERFCQLLTIAGPPGIGKSRLAEAFVDALGDDATALAGRCVAHGEGATYHALADLVNGLGENPIREVGELLAGNEPAIHAVLGAVGLSHEPTQPDETAWAVRRLLERLARERPLVVVIEDIHWAEPPLLDLLDHVAASLTACPVLLLCLTRPDLLEWRPAWAAPQTNRALVVLDALPDPQARELAAALGAGAHSERVAQRAEGNPLFVEHLVAVHDLNDAALPASIHAVLEARIDRLGLPEQQVLRCASIEGRTFHTGALAAALPSTQQNAIASHLVALTHKGLICATRAEFAGAEAFRFTHALIQEVAYTGLPKAARAELHACVGGWLETRREAPDEVVGYHLEQAYILAADIGTAGEQERELAARAARHLEFAARAARARADPAGASGLLKRATRLFESDSAARCALLPELGASLFDAGNLTEAVDVLDEAIAIADDRQIQARARVEREIVRLEAEPNAATQKSIRVADASLALFKQVGDAHGQCRAWSLRAFADWTAGRARRADEAWAAAAECARRANNDRELFDVLGWRATAAVLGPAPVADAIRRCEDFRQALAASPVAEAWIINPLASLHAMQGDLDLSDRCLRDAEAIFKQLGGVGASWPHLAAYARLVAGQPNLAEAALRTGMPGNSIIDNSSGLATTTALLAQAVYAQGRLAEAQELCQATANAASNEDIITQVIWRAVQARILASAGRHHEALALARAAVELIEPTDLLCVHGDARLDLAVVLRSCSLPDESDHALGAALRLYERKGNIMAATRARSLQRTHRSGGA